MDKFELLLRNVPGSYYDFVAFCMAEFPEGDERREQLIEYTKAISDRTKKHTDEGKWRCPKCSQWNSKDQTVCGHCGEENHNTEAK